MSVAAEHLEVVGGDTSLFEALREPEDSVLLRCWVPLLKVDELVSGAVKPHPLFPVGASPELEEV